MKDHLILAGAALIAAGGALYFEKPGAAFTFLLDGIYWTLEMRHPTV